MEGGIIILNRGPRAGVARAYGQISLASGVDLSAGIKYEGVNYIGPVDEIDFHVFEGLNISGTLSFNFLGFDVAGCVSWGPNFSGGGYTLGRGGSLGGGFPLFPVGGNISIGGIKSIK